VFNFNWTPFFRIMIKRAKYYRALTYRYRFLILWIVFLMEFIIPSFTNDIHDYHLVELIIYSIGIFAGFNILMARKKLFYVIVSLGILIVAVRFVNDDILPLWLGNLRDIVLVIYYLIIVYEIFKELIDDRRVDLNTIGAVMAGFFVMGIIGGVIFSAIENVVPGSFTGLTDGRKTIHDLVYFSFITLTTIGYGDISPVTQFAQRVTVLFGLIGNFYSTIVIGIIISKFLANNNKK